LLGRHLRTSVSSYRLFSRVAKQKMDSSIIYGYWASLKPLLKSEVTRLDCFFPWSLIMSLVGLLSYSLLRLDLERIEPEIFTPSACKKLSEDPSIVGPLNRCLADGLVIFGNRSAFMADTTSSLTFSVDLVQRPALQDENSSPKHSRSNFAIFGYNSRLDEFTALGSNFCTAVLPSRLHEARRRY
jgi:hypothetical protein